MVRAGLKVVGVTVALMAQLGCMEVQTTLTLAPDGSGSLSVFTLLQRKFLDIMEDSGKKDEIEKNLASAMPNALSDERRAKLAEAGLGLSKLGVEESEAGVSWNLGVTFREPASLAADLTGEGKGNATPSLWIYDLGGGKYELHMKNDALESKGLLDAPAGEEAPKKASKKKKDPSKNMDFLKDLLETMMDFKMGVEITVPGSVVSAAPEMGLTVSGSTASWSLSGATMMGEIGGEPSGESPAKQERVVVFQMAEGQSLPASVITAISVQGPASEPAPEPAPAVTPGQGG
jgi:hypothetical protein